MIGVKCYKYIKGYIIINNYNCVKLEYGDLIDSSNEGIDFIKQYIEMSLFDFSVVGFDIYIKLMLGLMFF